MAERQYFHPMELLDPSVIQQNIRESNWTRSFNPYFNSELPPHNFPVNPWPLSPSGQIMGQQDLFGYLPNHGPPVDRCAGLLTPSPCSSNSEISDRTSLPDRRSPNSALKRSSPFPQYQTQTEIWNPYTNFQYSKSMDSQLAPGPSQQQLHHHQYPPPSPHSVQSHQTEEQPSASSSLTDEIQVLLSANGEQRRNRKCKCPNCTSPPDPRLPASSKDRKKHLCHFEGCGKVYGKTSHLKAHLRWHVGDRPFRCGFVMCGKSFTRSDELTRHVKTHTGEKHFICSHCDKGFTRSDHLNKHSKIHFKDNNSQVVVKRGRKSQAYKAALAASQVKAEEPEANVEHVYVQVSDDALDMSRDPSPVSFTTISSSASTTESRNETLEIQVSDEEIMFAPRPTQAAPQFVHESILMPNSFYFQNNFANQQFYYPAPPSTHVSND